MLPAYWRGGTCGCRQRGRGRGATTTVSPTRPHDPNHQHRHHARKSSHDAPSRQAQPPNPTTQPARLRANPHTTTLEPLLQTGINERKRHHASQSSHNGSRHRQTARLKPPAPPQCEPILTYCPRASAPSRHQWPEAPPCEQILTQRPAQPMAGESAGSRMCGHAPSDRPRHRLRYQTQSGTSRVSGHTRRAESHTD